MADCSILNSINYSEMGIELGITIAEFNKFQPNSNIYFHYKQTHSFSSLYTPFFKKQLLVNTIPLIVARIHSCSLTESFPDSSRINSGRFFSWSLSMDCNPTPSAFGFWLDKSFLCFINTCYHVSITLSRRLSVFSIHLCLDKSFSPC